MYLGERIEVASYECYSAICKAKASMRVKFSRRMVHASSYMRSNRENQASEKGRAKTRLCVTPCAVSLRRQSRGWLSALWFEEPQTPPSQKTELNYTPSPLFQLSCVSFISLCWMGSPEFSLKMYTPLGKMTHLGTVTPRPDMWSSPLREKDLGVSGRGNKYARELAKRGGRQPNTSRISLPSPRGPAVA